MYFGNLTINRSKTGSGKKLEKKWPHKTDNFAALLRRGLILNLAQNRLKGGLKRVERLEMIL